MEREEDSGRNTKAMEKVFGEITEESFPSPEKDMQASNSIENLKYT